MYSLVQGGNGPPLAILDVAAEKVPALAQILYGLKYSLNVMMLRSLNRSHDPM